MTKLIDATSRIIVPLDVSSTDEAIGLIDELWHAGVRWFKVGLELITPGYAPDVVREIGNRGGRVFWDGKFDDIPNTVARATRQAVALGAAMVNVHASAGRRSLEAVVANKRDALALAVTVLTSIDEGESSDVFGDPTAPAVQKFVAMAEAAGCDGVVCSPADLGTLRAGAGLIKVTPGVRPVWAAGDDQRRVMTPGEAVAAGADYLVIGRPITRPPGSVGSPGRAVELIAAEIDGRLEA